MVTTINPATEERIADYPYITNSELDTALAASQEAFENWRRLRSEDRAECLIRLGEELNSRMDILARLASLEMGKPIAEAKAEVKKCAAACFHFAEFGPGYLADQILVDANPKASVTFQPLGPILGVMPWNFPYWQVIRFAAPTLLAGNTVIIKHAPNTFGSAADLADVFKSAHFPAHVYQSLRATIDQSHQIIRDRRCAGVSLTGSTRAGRSVAAVAGEALKKCVLELGGSDAYVILDDADVELAAEKCVQGRMLNSGQSCIAAKRFIVTKKNAKEFTSLVRERMLTYEMGDPMQEATKLGPLAREDLRGQLHEQVRQSVIGGAQLVLGGEFPNRKGYYYPPTVLTQVKPGQAAFDEELFGPVASIVEAPDESTALRLANHSNYGLGGAIFSRDVERAEILARNELQAGVCFVNEFVRSDARWPFGGIKDSGIGRELSEFGFHEFVNIKSVIGCLATF